MLRIVDKDSKTKFILRDEDEEPLSIDELVLSDEEGDEEEQEDESAEAKKPVV